MSKIKYFTHSITDIPSNLEQLRSKFPGFYFLEGKLDGKLGTYIVSSLEKGKDEFNKPIPSSEHKDYFFFPPKQIIEVQELLDSSIKDKETHKETYNLSSGYTIRIIPATEEPRKITISLFSESNELEEFTSAYGKMAYEIDQELFNNKDVSLQRGIKLIGLALKRSYTIPIDLINCLGLLGSTDIEPLTYICLGYKMDEDKKKVDSIS